MRAGGRLEPARLTAVVLLVSLSGGAILMGAAMALYPGGDVVNPRSAGHSWWLNYLCDLVSERAVNGASNLSGAAAARTAMVSFALAWACFWMMVPATLSLTRGRHVIRIAGAISAAGLVAVTFATGRLHAPAIFASIAPAGVATALALRGLLVARRRSLVLVVAACTLAAGLAGAALYAARLGGALPPDSPSVPVLQRITALLLLGWMAAVAGMALRARPPAGTSAPRVMDE